MKLRDRIKGLRRVDASELIPNPKNWRTHPESQANAMKGILAEVGVAGAALARETPEGLMLIDGHLRAEVMTGQVPVLVLDVNEEEADKILASYDTVSQMATIDAEKLEELLVGVATDNDAVTSMLNDLAVQANLVTTSWDQSTVDPDSVDDYNEKEEVAVLKILTPRDGHEAVVEKVEAVIRDLDATLKVF